MSPRRPTDTMPCPSPAGAVSLSAGRQEQLHAGNKGCPNEFNLADHVMFLLQSLGAIHRFLLFWQLPGGFLGP